MSDTVSKISGVPLPPKKPRQGRSPAFPFIALGKALERAETFRVAEGGRPKHFTPLTAACKAWGIGAQTGTAIQTVAALGHYGLFEFEGSSDKRSARLTELAFNILLDKQPISPERDKAIQAAALLPKIHAELWGKWQTPLPSDPTIETFLVRDRGFSETGARDLIAEYKETLKFSKLDQSGPIPIEPDAKKEVDGPPEDEIPEVGDFVQVEIGGALQLEKAVRVRAIQEHEGQKWVFVDGYEAGIPMEQAIIERKGQVAGAKAPITPPLLREDPPPAAMRKLVVPLSSGGDAILSFPERLTSDGYEELEAYLQVFLKRAKQKAEKTEAAVEKLATFYNKDDGAEPK